MEQGAEGGTVSSWVPEACGCRARRCQVMGVTYLPSVGSYVGWTCGDRSGSRDRSGSSMRGGGCNTPLSLLLQRGLPIRKLLFLFIRSRFPGRLPLPPRGGALRVGRGCPGPAVSSAPAFAPASHTVSHRPAETPNAVVAPEKQSVGSSIFLKGTAPNVIYCSL